MSIRMLKTLVAVHEHGTFSAAADAVFVTHAAVSQQMKTLEEELQVQIFDRSTRTPTITPLGHALVEKARETIQSYDNLVLSVLGKEALKGEFLLGAVPTALTGLMPRTLTILKDNCPQLHLRISTGLTHQLLIELERGNIEGALVTRPQVLPPDIICQDIVTEEFEVLAAPTVENDDPVDLLKSNPFIRFNRQAVAGQQIESWLQTKGIQVTETMELLDLGAISSMVAANLGVSICPKSCVPGLLSSGLKRIPLGPNGPLRTLSMVRLSKSPKLHVIEQIQLALQQAASGQDL